MSKITSIKCQEKIEKNIGLVKTILKRFNVSAFDYDDLMQAGLIGLWKAAYNFDESKGFKFSSYAVPYIMGEIKKEYRNFHLIKISRNYYKIIYQLKMSDSFDEEEIMKKTGCSHEDLIMAYNFVNSVTLIEDESTIQDYESECSLAEEKRLNKTEELVIALFKKKYTQKRIAFRIGISQSTVSRIIKKYKESYNLV